MNLFAAAGLEQDIDRPLAERMRPRALEHVVGQGHLVGDEGVLRRLLEAGSFGSLIFWGPPGTGKTTLARLVAEQSGLDWVELSAIFAGVADLKKVFEQARGRRQLGRGTLLFIDEIHRFNRTQQDALLPVVEDGTVVLIGATTENPSFSLVSPLLSRARVLTFQRLEEPDLERVLERVERELGKTLPLEPEARALLLRMGDGDARALLTILDDLLKITHTAPLSPEALLKIVQRRAPLHDKGGDGHYNLISALHKAVRGSDPDAALYYFARMIDGGEDPRYIGRRLIRMASEDIGLADRGLLSLCIAAYEGYENLGSPEGELMLAEAVIALALAPKSNAVYVAYKAAMKAAREHGSLSPPKHILNAPTRLMKSEGYGEGYAYDHDEEGAFSGQDYFPEKLGRMQFYQPKDYGQEATLKVRLQQLHDIRARKKL